MFKLLIPQAFCSKLSSLTFHYFTTWEGASALRKKSNLDFFFFLSNIYSNLATVHLYLHSKSFLFHNFIVTLAGLPPRPVNKYPGSIWEVMVPHPSECVYPKKKMDHLNFCSDGFFFNKKVKNIWVSYPFSAGTYVL